MVSGFNSPYDHKFLANTKNMNIYVTTDLPYFQHINKHEKACGKSSQQLNIIFFSSNEGLRCHVRRSSKCLQHHQQRWCKILWTGKKFIALNIQSFVVDLLFGLNFAYCFGKITYFYFSYLLNCYFVALFYIIILKTVLLKYI